MNVRSTTTKEHIIQKSVHLLAHDGYTGTSIRKVADAAGVQPSLIYNYFTDKEALMREVRFYIIGILDRGVATMDFTQRSSELLKDLLNFQFTHRTKIVALL